VVREVVEEVVGYQEQLEEVGVEVEEVEALEGRLIPKLCPSERPQHLPSVLAGEASEVPLGQRGAILAAAGVAAVLPLAPSTGRATSPLTP